MLKRLLTALAAAWLCLAGPVRADPGTSFALLPLIQAQATTSQDGDGQWQFAFATGSPSTPIDLTGITFDLRWHPASGGTPNPVVISLAAGQYLTNGGPTGILTLTIPQARLRVLPVGTYVASLVASLNGATSSLGLVTIKHAALGPSSITSLSTTARNAASATTVGFIPGPQGLSAYQVAVANGFTGTQAQWLASLVGATGAPGNSYAIGTTAGTVAAGNDGRITGAAQKSANLSDLSNPTLARITLGAAASGSNSDISALSGLSTPLSGSQGGTGYGSVSAALDGLFSSTQGAILYRGASGWQGLGPGTSGQVLQTAGTGANPSWTTLPTAATVPPAGQVRLSYSSSTTLQLCPSGGNQIYVAGANRTLSACLSLSNAGLSFATKYYAYATWTGSAVSYEFSTTGHATDTASGFEVKSGDVTRTLVGMVYTAGSSGTGTFSDSLTFRGVLSYFSRRGVKVSQAVTGSTANGSATVISGTLTFLAWADETVAVDAAGAASNTGIANVTTSLVLNGSAFGQPSSGTVSAASYAVAVNAKGIAAPGDLTEGVQTAAVAGSVNAGTATWAASQFITTRG